MLRHTSATLLRAFVSPILIMAFLSYSRNIFAPNSEFGIADPIPIRDFTDALQLSNRPKILFINNGLQNGLIDRAINQLASIAQGVGKDVVILSGSDRIPSECPSSLRGVSDCYGSVQFWSSPEEGDNSYWNYTLRIDAGLLFNQKIDTTSDKNDHEIYILPFQNAIDTVITGLSHSNNGEALPGTIDEYPFTDLTQEERDAEIRKNFQGAIQEYIAITFTLGLIGVVYHMTGFIATEREIGISQLIQAMMPSRYSWTPQLIRFLSYHLAFDFLYLPGQVIGALIVWRGLFVDVSAGLIIIYFIIAGWSLTSLSILGAAFFRKSQLSGISVTMITLLLGIMSQVMSTSSDAVIGVLSFLFIPCNFVYYIGWVSRYQEVQQRGNLGESPPNSPWNVAGGLFWLFAIIQIFMYPALGAIVENYMYGTKTKARKIVVGSDTTELGDDAVILNNFSKTYRPNPIARFFGRKEVHAVKELSISAQKGQILALLGANGSGKSTTLDAIAGINRVSGGSITINGTGGLGIAPQKNVLWDELTVEEHIKIFNRLKSPGKTASKAEIQELVKAIDLESKQKAQSKTLSGGQKRKLQLGMMLTGGSTVCCVDEVSSGLDPLSRRKIWDILLAERGNRTMILTTHFLDEADLLADQIVVLSKGTLRAKGSSVELKENLGGGYRIHLHGARSLKKSPDVNGVKKKISFDVITYIAPSSALAAEVIKTLSAEGLHDYRFSGPTIEDVFLQLAEEVNEDGKGGVLDKDTTNVTEKTSDENSTAGKDGLKLLPGRKIGFMRQASVLFLKRVVILKSNWLIYLLAFLLPILAARLTTLFVEDQQAPGCSPADQISSFSGRDVTEVLDELFIVGGPSDKISLPTLASVFLPVLGGGTSGDSSSNITETAMNFLQNLKLVDTFEDFQNTIRESRKNITPGGLWLGDDASPPTLAWKASDGMFLPGYAQNILDMLLTNTTIVSAISIFDVPINSDIGDSLQLLTYFGLALAAFPGFFALYPNVERRRNVRGLQYSNGVRSFPLWLAYTIFDFSIILVSMVIVIIIWAFMSDVWYNIAYLFPVLMLYGLASILLSYVISIFSSSQLSSYAFTSAGQAIIFLVYLATYLFVLTFSPVNRIDSDLEISNWVISIVAPIGPAVRALFVALNIFSEACDGEQLNPNPGSMLAYGGPILYLVLQSVAYISFLIMYDSGAVATLIKRLRSSKTPAANDGHPYASDEEVAAELVRVTSSHSRAATRQADGHLSMPGTTDGDDPATQSGDGLRVVHLTKKFGKTTAVDNVTFGIQRGEVFALLGPNGAGKSTTISLIRGDIRPSARGGGDIFVENISVSRNRASARANLGVCPQFDAVDSMTVVEHLRFYARIRGVEDVEHNVQAVIQAVGLEPFKSRMASHLSGGNKRKLSLGIALMGNPTVVLLDEPSSGLDAAAKRVMWRTLATVVTGRSILLTTHSMEEADALAGRAGILSKRMLAMGTTEGLRNRWGNLLYVHLVCRGAPRTDESTVEGIRHWISHKFGDGVEIDEKTWHGQMRFTIPVDVIANMETSSFKVTSERAHGIAPASGGAEIGKLVVMLEEERQKLGVDHFSVSPTTLDQVFLNIVGKHNVKEENYGEEKKKRWYQRK